MKCECNVPEENPTLTEEPILLKEETDGSAGPDGKYVLFGDWPQSLKKEDTIIEESKSYNVNGWDCYKGSDGAFYVKATAKPFLIKDDAFFSNGEIVIKDKEYFFKIESIKWRILDNNYGGGKLLLSEKALCGCCFDNHFYYNENDSNAKMEDAGIERTINGKSVYGNNYKYSTIRAYLNGLDGTSYDVLDFRNKGFIDKAFSKKAIDKINTVTVDNSAISTIDDENNIDTADEYVCKNTNDKIFLLSIREVTKKSYGFDSYDIGLGGENKTLTSSRSLQYTDYSLATGVYTFATEDYRNTCCWWLRSPVYDIVVSARNVYFDGSTDYSYDCIENDQIGVIPALSISF